MPLGRVGVRISPYAKYNNVRDADPDATLAYVGRMLDDAGVAYLHAADTNGWSGPTCRVSSSTRAGHSAAR